MSTDLHTLSGAYAVNALSHDEAEEFRKHLDGCPACREEVRELQEAAALLGAAASVEPPAHLKASVMRAADQLSQLPPLVTHIDSVRRPRWTPRILGAAAAVVMVVAAGIGFSQMQQDPDSHLAAGVTRVFDAPDAHIKTVGSANGGKVSLATSKSLREMAIDTNELPELTGEQVYQLWTITGSLPKSAGLLEDPGSGQFMDLPDEGIEVAITIEPAGGSKQPTSDPIVRVTPSEV